MRSFVSWLSGAALTLGGPGIFAVAALDSSFVSLPQINDLLVVLNVTQNKHLVLYYAAMATLGSVTGCFLLYYLAGKGGETFLRNRTSASGLDRALGLYRRHGLLALLVPALLPPPAPFKLFVLGAGLAGVRPLPFITAIVIGRGARYIALGLLAVYFGDAALELMRTRGPEVALWVVGLILLGIAIWWGSQRIRKARAA